MKNLISALSVGCCLSAAQATTWEISLNLNGANEVPGNSSTATGGAFGTGIRYDDTSNVLSLNVAYGVFGFSALTGDNTGASLNLGSPGEQGVPLVDLADIHLPLSTVSGLYSGNLTLSQAVGSALLAGTIYMNINSSAFPGGEIRGQLTVVPEPETVALAVLGFGALALALRRRQA